VESLTRGIANKFLHAPMQALRAAAHDGDSERLDLLRAAFQLQPEPAGPSVLAETSATVEQPGAPETGRDNESAHAYPLERGR
jgi:hypothetical protein